MPKFYIEKLLVTGNGKEPSSVEFGAGLNFVVGPSNTGKSYMLECIDYIFGFEEKLNKPFRFDKSLGYDCIRLYTRTEKGTVIFERKLDEIKISVSGTDTDFEYGDYSINASAKRNINSIWLQMIGIDEPHQILATKSGKKQRLSWRSMMHMFLIKQDHVARPSSVLLSPSNFYSDTASKASLLFLLTGQDAEKVITPEDKKIKAAKKAAIMGYIKDTLKRLVLREGELLDLRSSDKIPDLEIEVNAIVSEIDEIQNRIKASIQESKHFMDKIYSYNGRLTECETISARFSILKNQYLSDIQRLTFVVEGEKIKPSTPPNKKCPFCDGDIALNENTSYIEAAKAELSHIRTHLTELEKAEQDLFSKRDAIQASISELETEKVQIDSVVADELKPRVSALKEKLDNYRQAIELTKEIEFIQDEERKYSVELFEKETESNSPETQYEIKEDFDREIIDAFEDKLIAILKTVKFEGYSSARLNMDTFDLEIGGRQKATAMGGGYCGILNTIVAIATMDYLSRSGRYAPGFLIADSPLSQLSESEFTDKADTMKSAFIQYLLDHHSYGQIIIVEQKEKLPFSLSNCTDVNIIEFTKNKDHGRYGFLNGIYE